MRLIAYSLSVLLLAPLAGCITTGDSAGNGASGRSPGSKQEAMLFQPKPGLTPNERYREGVSLLEVGQAGQAKAELLAYLEEEPGGRYAKSSIGLLKQIRVDPQAELGKEHFLYKMQPGDSVSSVAQQYLGDPLKFYILARYNDLANPSQMKVGQTIKVPGKEGQQKAEREPPTETEPLEEPQANGDEPGQDQEAAQGEVEGAVEGDDTSDEPAVVDSASPDDQSAVGEDQLAVIPPLEEGETETLEAEVEQIQLIMLRAQDLSGAGDYGAAAKELESGLARFPDAVQMKEQAAANYVTFADVLISRGRFEDARTAVERANELMPGYEEATIRLDLLDRRREANEFYLAGKEFLAADQPIEAFESFDAAAKIVPDHPAAAERANLVPVVTEELHRKAMIFYRRQDLDAALGIWDKVLVIDPNYKPALIHRDQAIELKERLKSLPSEQPAEQ